MSLKNKPETTLQSNNNNLMLSMLVKATQELSSLLRDRTNRPKSLLDFFAHYNYQNDIHAGGVSGTLGYDVGQSSINGYHTYVLFKKNKTKLAIANLINISLKTYKTLIPQINQMFSLYREYLDVYVLVFARIEEIEEIWEIYKKELENDELISSFVDTSDIWNDNTVKTGISKHSDNDKLTIHHIFRAVPYYISEYTRTYILTYDTLRQLQIFNFKGISQLSLNFSEQVTILLGKNASGKTSILQALALALLPDDNTDKDREFEKMIKIGFSIAVIKSFFSKNDFHDQTIIIDQNRKRGNNLSIYICPILLGYGTNMFYNKGEKNKFQDFVKAMLLGNANHYFTRSLFRNFDDNFVDILDVLNHLYYEEQREREEIIRNNSQEMRTLIALTINDLLPKDLIQIKLVEERSYYFVNQAGDNLDTDQLSEGYRANVILLGDMLCRLMAMRGHLQAEIPIAEVFKEMRGVVIIDEFDRHLHPSWQKVFVDNLLKVLPNMQFVLTTHNPMAILNRKENEVLKLVFSEDGQITTQTGHATADLDVSLVLLEYFEMDSLVSEQLQGKIERYQEAKLNDESIAEDLGKELEDLLVTLPIHDKLYWQYLKFLRDKGISFSDLQLNKIDLKSLFTNQ